MSDLNKLTDTQVWDELSEELGFGVVPDWNGPKYRIRDLVERQKQLGRFLSEEERKEFEIQEKPKVLHAYILSEGVLIVFSNNSIRLYEKSILGENKTLDIANVVYAKGAPLKAIQFA